VISLLTTLSDEQPVEAATVGREGMVGTPVVLGVRVTNAQALAQVPGIAIRLDAERFLSDLRRSNSSYGTRRRCTSKRRSRWPATVVTRSRSAARVGCS
jgi:hypothetical protein